MSKEHEPTHVELIIPCQPEFVGVARLAILGVASRMPFTYEEIEDLRIAVGELCTSSVEWAQRNKRPDSKIILRTEITPDKLIVNIADTAGPRHCDEVLDKKDTEAEELDRVFITLLVDEVEITPQPEGTCVRMVKHAVQR